MRLAWCAVISLVACDGTSAGPVDEPVACEARPVTAPTAATFVDISAASGIQARNFVPTPTTPIPINDHSRLAFVDLDGDGCDDIVAHDLFPNPKAGIPYTPDLPQRLHRHVHRRHRDQPRRDRRARDTHDR